MMHTKKVRHQDLGVFLIRAGLAIVFIAHGWSKFSAMDQTVAFFQSLGFVPFLAYFVATVELVGGVAMLCGLFTDIAGVALAIDMFVAIFSAKSGKGFASYEFELMLLLAALGIALMHDGTYALKCACEKCKK